MDVESRELELVYLVVSNSSRGTLHVIKSFRPPFPSTEHACVEEGEKAFLGARAAEVGCAPFARRF